MAQLAPGDPAPAFSAPDQNGSTISSGDFSGKKLFVYFYPKANTSG
jgi:peroxiredoxin Q/BCP